MKYSKMQCRSVRYGTMQYTLIQYSTVQFGMLQYGTLQCGAVPCSTWTWSGSLSPRLDIIRNESPAALTLFGSATIMSADSQSPPARNLRQYGGVISLNERSTSTTGSKQGYRF
jgi:hypothetical protein